MKRIVIISDSHGARNNIEKVLDVENYDYLFFLGDGLKDLQGVVSAEKLVAVSGNCDIFADEAKQRMTVVENTKILLTHGHLYKVKWGIGALSNEGTRLGVKIVCYGHTHQQSCETIDGVVYINPGAMANGYYAVLEINNGEIIKIENKNLY